MKYTPEQLKEFALQFKGEAREMLEEFSAEHVRLTRVSDVALPALTKIANEPCDHGPSFCPGGCAQEALRILGVMR